MLPPGYHIASVVAVPPVLTISGPARHVEAIESALTDTVDATGVAGRAAFETMAYLPDPLVHITSAAPVKVIVTTTSSRAGVP
jgi:hypothetical protein